jgi:hypothetical protein
MPIRGTAFGISYSSIKHPICLFPTPLPLLLPPTPLPPSARTDSIRSKRRERHILLINVRTLAIRFTILLFTLASPPGPAPNAGSEAEEADQPMRARKRSSERMAMAFVTRTMTCIR